MNSLNALIALSLPQATENQFIQAILSTGIFAKFVLLVIFVFSVVSWAVILQKLVQYKRIARQNERFLDDFERLGGDFGSLHQSAERYDDSVHSAIFSESYRELRSAGRVVNGQLIFDRQHVVLVQRQIERVAGEQIVRLEKRLVLLATTANVCPFLGLLGTVWGVLGTFMTMSNMGSSLTLQLIGPGIAEALTTTILGLGAAIPATVAYNHLVNRVAVFRMEMESYALRLLSVLDKNIIARSLSAKGMEGAPRKQEAGQGVQVEQEVSL